MCILLCLLNSLIASLLLSVWTSVPGARSGHTELSCLVCKAVWSLRGFMLRVGFEVRSSALLFSMQLLLHSAVFCDVKA